MARERKPNKEEIRINTFCGVNKDKKNFLVTEIKYQKTKLSASDQQGKRMTGSTELR